MIDLHTHSHYSDGSDSPAGLVALAESLGLEAIALCDHNTVSGLPEFLEAGSRSTVQTVPGAELTSAYKGKELHILALFIPPHQYDAVRARMAPFRKAKEENNLSLYQALTAAGFRLDKDRIFQGSIDYVNRMMFAEEMTRMGYTSSTSEAFDKYLSESRGLYKPAPREDALEIIAFIRSIGAVAVLAHPLHSITEELLREFLPKAKAAGLAAMETYYSQYNEETTALACRLAEEYGLKKSGGSDYHGIGKPDVAMGTGTGNLCIPYSVLNELKQ